LKVIAVIPSRWESSRFPGKPMTDIAGMPMIERVYRQAMDAGAFSAVYVATDHDMIYNHIIAIGGKAVRTGLQDNGTLRVAEAIGKIPDSFDVIVNLQGDQPILPSGVIQELINAFQYPGCQIATLARHSNNTISYENPNLVKVTFGEDMIAGEFSRQPLPGTSADNYYYHIGIYAFRKGVLESLLLLPPSPDEITERLEQLRWMYHGYPVHIAISHYDVHAVDVPDDIDTILQLLKAHN